MRLRFNPVKKLEKIERVELPEEEVMKFEFPKPPRGVMTLSLWKV